MNKTSSLKNALSDPEWFADVWFDARADASKEMGIGLDIFPEDSIWTTDTILSSEFYPD